MKYSCCLPIFLALLIFGCASNPGKSAVVTGASPAPKKVFGPDEYLPITEAIDLVKDKQHREFLVGYAKGLGPGDDAVVAQHETSFEFIVSHASHDGRTGGAEQYFMDKKTGKITMGWHEHPMPMPEMIEEKVEDKPISP